MLTRKHFILILLLASQLAVFAQSPSKLLKKANKEFAALGYVNAIDFYEKALKKSKKLSEEEVLQAKIKLGLSYRQTKNYANAERVFREALAKSPVLRGDAIKSYLYLAQILASNGKHAESAFYYKKYTELQEQDKRGEKFVELYTSYLEALKRNTNSYRIDYLGINSNYSDFSPTYYKNGLVFVSAKNNTTKAGIRRLSGSDSSPFLDLFFIEDLKSITSEETKASAIGSSQKTPVPKVLTEKRLGDDYYSPSTANDSRTISRVVGSIVNSELIPEIPSIISDKFSKNLNSKWHEGSCTFYHDFSKIILTRNSQPDGNLLQVQKNISRLKLFIADNVNNVWKNAVELPFNSNDYSCMHPSLSKDDQILVFASDMPGGYGGTDIWMVRNIGGVWSKPVNMGGNINTRGNEVYPFLDDAGNMYFSTDGHPGLGDLDIFYVPLNPISFMPSGMVRNVGSPINSEKDDFGIIADAERRTGFFSSNRKKGGNDDDIYKFTRTGNLYGCREVIINVTNGSTQKPFENFKFDYIAKKTNAVKETAITNTNGSIRLCLEADTDFKFDFEKQGFHSQTTDFSNKTASDYIPSLVEISLIPIEKKVEKIFGGNLVSTPQTSSNLEIFKGTITSGESGLPLAGVLVKFTNQQTGEAQQLITKADGSYEFSRNTTYDYLLEASKENFGNSIEIVKRIEEKRPSFIASIFKSNRKKVEIPNYFDTRLYKVGDVVSIPNIYYEAKETNLNKSAIKEIDKLAATMRRNPSMIIEILSHTDTRGNAQENLNISQLRANEVAQYLIKNGISSLRIKATGMGEKKPVNGCSDGVQCTESEHQRNRRTEFKILSVERRTPVRP